MGTDGGDEAVCVETGKRGVVRPSVSCVSCQRDGSRGQHRAPPPTATPIEIDFCRLWSLQGDLQMKYNSNISLDYLAHSSAIETEIPLTTCT